MIKKQSGEITDWVIQSMVLIAAVATIVALYFQLFNPKTPQFIIETHKVEPGEQIIIKAANKQANRNEPLNVEFDKHVFENAGEPFKKNYDGKQLWRFNIKTVDFTPEMIKPGAHKMRFGFKEEKMCSDEQAVSFTITSPPPPPLHQNIEGFYKAPFDEPGLKYLITLTIEEKVDKNPTLCTFKYILAGKNGTSSGMGSFNSSQKTISIPGLGEGKVGLNRKSKFILNFIYKGREVQFVQSNI